MKTLTILLVEDLPSHAAIAIKILEHAGFQVIWKSSAEEALEELQKTVPDLLLIDIALPKMSGAQLVQELKKQPAMASIPMIAITAHAMLGIKETLLAQGFTDYIPKPYTIELLTSTVKKVLTYQKNA